MRMSKDKFKVIKNNAPLEKSYNTLDKAQLKVIDKAEMFTKDDFVEIKRDDILKVIDGYDEEEKEVLELCDRIMKVKKSLYGLLEHDLTFRPYIILFDKSNLDIAAVTEMEKILKDSSIDTKEKVNCILDIIDDCI